MTGRPLHRFFYPGVIGTDPSVWLILPEGESHHLLSVLRLKSGDEVAVFDSHAACWRAEVAGREGNLAKLTLIELAATPVSSSSRLVVAASLLKRRAMDLMIEKLSELDVASLQPIICKRTVVGAGEKTGPATPPRWSRISLAAAKQAGRNSPMGFDPVTPLGDWLRRERPATLACFAHPGEGSVGLGEWLGARAGLGLPVLVAIGPEGGFTPGEVEGFKSAGFQAVGLGPLVLRAETAAITVAAACRVML